MKNGVLGVALMVVALVTCSAYADSYGPFGNYRRVGPTGRYYVVIRKSFGWDPDPGRGGPVTYALG